MCMCVSEICAEGIFVTFPWWLKNVKRRSKIVVFSNERHFEIWFPKQKTITFFWSKFSKTHKKDPILHVTTTFSQNKGKQEQAVDPFHTPLVHPFPSFSRKKNRTYTSSRGRISFKTWEVGGWCNPVILKFVFFKVLEVICTLNFVCKLELLFSNISSKTSHENVFIIFYVKINFCLKFSHKMKIFQLSRACSHYDVIVRSHINVDTHFVINGKRMSIPIKW